MSDHRGRIDEILHASLKHRADLLSLILVIREALDAERAEGWREGHADGIRDAYTAEQMKADRERLREAAEAEEPYA